MVARTSAEQFRGAHDLSEIASRLRVRYVVEGSVRRDGRELRVSARLVDTVGGSPVWSQTFDRDLDDVFQVQSQLSGAIAGALARTLGTPRPGTVVRKSSPPRPDAYAAFLKGQFIFRTQPDNHSSAVELLSESIALDPDYAPAHLELAAVRASLALDRVSPPSDLVDGARQEVDRALDLEPHLADALALRAWLRFFNDWDWNGGTQGFEAALAISPSSSVAHHRYALLLMTAGRFDAAVRHCRQAMDLDPLSYRLGEWLLGRRVLCPPLHGGRAAGARIGVAGADVLRWRTSSWGPAWPDKGGWTRRCGAYREAIAASPDDPDALSSLGRALALAGQDRTRPGRILARLQAPDAAVPPSHYELAYLLGALGQTDQAFAELDEGPGPARDRVGVLGGRPALRPAPPRPAVRSGAATGGRAALRADFGFDFGSVSEALASPSVCRSRPCVAARQAIRPGGRPPSGVVTVPFRMAPTSSPTPGLSIFFPAYNDSGTIASMVVSALLTARTLTPDYEVIVVNDGSRDLTPQILDELARMYPARCASSTTRRTAGTAARCAAGSPRRARSSSSTPTATRSTTRARWRCSGSAWPTTWTWSTATRSAGPTRSTASSSAASTTTR